MPAYVCVTCGVQHAESDSPPPRCPICEDERQYVGRQALLVQTRAGNVLWDCIGFVDDATIAAVRERGGLEAIAISHPHFYGACMEWSQAFGGVPVYIHAADRQWVMRPSPSLALWEGEALEPLPGLTVVH